MSLVERAAKRLEELGKGRSQGAHGRPVAPAETSDSLIERAAQRIEPANRRRPASGDTPATLPVSQVPRGIDDDVDRDVPARREPKFGDPASQASDTSGERRHTPSVLRKGERITLDLGMLASAGYLEPDDPESATANEFRKIKRPLIQACQGKLAAPVQNANRIMVTSSVPGEGKSFIAFNLALSIAMERDSTVLLIDADTTRRTLSQQIGIDSKAGLLDLLAGKQQVSDTLLRTNVDRLSLLPAGARRRHATELLASDAMERLVEHLASRYADRILIFDTPPLLGAPEPAVLASHMGQIIVVVQADKTTRKVLGNALTTIQSCPLVTTVLNKTSAAEAAYYYYAA